MKEKKVLKRLMTFFITDCKALEEYLDQMALKGWKLKKLGFIMEFEKCEPSKIIYSVRAFENENSFVSLDENERKNVAEKGWVFISSHNHICVFMTTNENVVEINIDSFNEYKVIKEKIYKQKILPLIMNLPLFTLMLLMFINNIEDDMLSKMFVYTYGTMSSMILLHVSFYIFWKIRANDFLKSQKANLYNGEKQISFIKVLTMIFYLACIYIYGTVLISVILSAGIGEIIIIMFMLVSILLYAFFSSVNVKNYEY